MQREIFKLGNFDLQCGETLHILKPNLKKIVIGVLGGKKNELKHRPKHHINKNRI